MLLRDKRIPDTTLMNQYRNYAFPKKGRRKTWNECDSLLVVGYFPIKNLTIQVSHSFRVFESKEWLTQYANRGVFERLLLCRFFASLIFTRSGLATQINLILKEHTFGVAQFFKSMFPSEHASSWIGKNNIQTLSHWHSSGNNLGHRTHFGSNCRINR